MERLTYRLNDQFDNPTDSIILKPYLRYEDPETRKKILNRLAAYEDTGLEPEKIKKLRELCTDEVAELARILRKAIESGEVDHIRNLIRADQDGRLVVLPCKVGDTIWRIKCFADWPDIGKPYVEADAFLYRDIHYFGKTVFLTREEAEAALSQKGGTHEADSV